MYMESKQCAFIALLALSLTAWGCDGSFSSSSGEETGSTGETTGTETEATGGESTTGLETTGEESGSETGGDIVVDLRADTNRDGLVDFNDPTDDEGEDVWADASGAIFLANIDDDEEVCKKWGNDVDLAACHDAADDVLNGPDDALDMAPLQVAASPDAPDTTSATLSVEPAGRVRVFRVEEGVYTALPLPATFLAADLQAGIELAVEGLDIIRNVAIWNGRVNFTLAVQDDGHDVDTDTVHMRVSPVMLYHHLLDAETIYTAAHSNWDAESKDFIADIKAGMAESGSTAEFQELVVQDQWAQDYFETGYMSMPGAEGSVHAIRVAFRSANVQNSGNPDNPLRPAGQVVFSYMRGKDMAAVQEYDINHSAQMDSLNSFGNTETIPPYSLDGVDYPLGRIFRGKTPSFYPDPFFTKMLEDQAIQPAVYINTAFLLVGHVDEVFSFVATDTERGWALLQNDPPGAIAMFEEQIAAGNGDVPLFVDRYWDSFNESDNGTACVEDTDCPENHICLMKAYEGAGSEKCSPLCATNADCAKGTGCKEPWFAQEKLVCHDEYAAVTIAEVLDNADVMAESAKTTIEVEEGLEVLKAATGVTDDEVIHIPYLHESINGFSVAFQPGTVNGLHVEKGHFYPPDPHGPVIDGKDLMKSQFEEALAAIDYEVHWVEDWDLYHRMLGEVHCGSNAKRALPSVNWWETGR